MLRSTFAKGKPKKFYGATETSTIKRLKKNYKSNNPQCHILNHFAPLKQKPIRNNNQLDKNLRKNKFNKERNIENWSEYKRQRNFCSNLLKRHFNSHNDVTENENFWKTIKPFFTEKNKTTTNIILTENNQTVMEDKAICQIFTYFANVTKDLKLQQVDESQSFENKESCRLIWENHGVESFSFKSISKDDIIEAVKKLPSNKASISNVTNFNKILQLAIVKSLQVFLTIL